MEMVAILDSMALAMVHITLKKQLVKMPFKVAHT